MENKESIQHIESIQNIVFDMGNVLIEYDADRVIRHYTEDEGLVREIHAAVFSSAEWLKLDAGLISEEMAERQWLPRLSSDTAREVARLSFRDWHLYNMWPKPGMAEVVYGVKARRQRVYVLSNASLRLPSCYRAVMPGAEMYDGVFFSASYGCIKPQDIIYQRFFQVFSLEPSTCFFIDDLPENVEAACKNGMAGYVFSDGDVRALRTILHLTG